jgi:hypothetical protein
MKKAFFCLVLFALTFWNCTKEDEYVIPQKPKTLIKVTPDKAKIGDTIVIEGNNLDEIFLNFNYIRNNGLISKDSNKIVTKVPVLYNEKVTIKAMRNVGIVADSLEFNLVGLFPLASSTYDASENLEVVNDSVVFSSGGSKLIKTIDGGYHWTVIKSFGGRINSIYFIDENHGWIGIKEDGESKLYYTNDGGDSFLQVLALGNYYGGHYFMDMYFSTPESGYLLTGKGDIYGTNDNESFDLVYSFPLSNRESGYLEFYSLSVHENTIMATGNSGKSGETPVLIKGKDGIFDYYTFDEVIGKVQIISEQEAYLIKGNKLYFSSDEGNNWEIVERKENEDIIFNFNFMGKLNGFVISIDEYYSPTKILQIVDGELKHHIGDQPRDFYNLCDLSFHNNIGFIRGGNRIWKFIEG